MTMNISIDVVVAAIIVSTGSILVLALGSMSPQFIELNQQTIGNFIDKCGLCTDVERLIDSQQGRIIAILAHNNAIGQLNPPIAEVYPSSTDFNCTVILVGLKR